MRRRCRSLLAVVLAVGALATSSCAGDGATGVRTDAGPGQPGDDEPLGPRVDGGGAGSPAAGPRDGQGTAVIDVIDGDTIELAGVGDVRLIGIDTPEGGTCGFDEATEFTEARLGGAGVRYVVGAEQRDRYGRLLAYVYDDEGRMHNLELAVAGYAEVLTIPPNVRYASRFEAAVTDARSRYGQVPRGSCEGEPPIASREHPNPSAQPRGRGGGTAGGGLPAPPPDLDCSDVEGPVRVGGGDAHRLDSDGDGIGCE